MTRPVLDGSAAQRLVLVLDPLSDSDSDMLVDELSDLSVETRERIVQAAEGNPLFVEQLVAMQAESGNGEL